MPFNDDRGSIGFFATFILEWISGYVLMFIFSCVNSFYFGASWHIETSISDMLSFFHQLDMFSVQICKEIFRENRKEIEHKFLSRLKEFIEMHNDVMQ